MLYFDCSMSWHDGEVYRSKEICFAFWKYRDVEKRQQLKDVGYHVKPTEETAKWFNFCFYDIGLKKFFTQEQINNALNSGDLILTVGKYTHKNLLAIMTLFRYYEEYPEVVKQIYDYVDIGADPAEAVFAVHYHKDLIENYGHAVFCPRYQSITVDSSDYLSRIGDNSIPGCHKAWGGDNAELTDLGLVCSMSTFLRSTDIISKYFKNRERVKFSYLYTNEERIAA